MTSTFASVYRGKVEDNDDPMNRSRVQVSVPAVLGEGRLAWAEPCIPYTGNQVSLGAVPPVGTSVWVQFEGGDPNYPVVAGCLWEDGENSASALPQEAIFAADGITVTASPVPGAGGLTIEVGSPAVTTPVKLVLGTKGLELSVGASKITIDGVQASVNDNALDVV
jgi:hypothetical protein